MRRKAQRMQERVALFVEQRLKFRERGGPTPEIQEQDSRKSKSLRAEVLLQVPRDDGRNRAAESW